MQIAVVRPYILPLAASEATRDRVGGKGASLATLARGGLPVPSGFHVTTAAYTRFVEANGLSARIRAAAADASVADPPAQQRAAAAIAALFERAEVTEDVAVAVRRAYAELDGGRAAVAVRSSATAEDLPEASFAGQQESYLNVRGEAALLEAVRRCWGSLWTARAMSYRARQGIPPERVAMGVVVQRLVPADAAGVLFTANPSTGARDELLVNASFGLGDAVVAGEVTPDTYVLDRATGAVRNAVLGGKAAMSVAAPDGGTVAETVPETRRRERALADAPLRALADLGERIERLFGGVPMDIEWAMAGGTGWILQARPITNLPPAPPREVRWEPPVPGSAWVRRQVVENMPEPLSPLFDELYVREGLERSADAIYAVFGVPEAINDLVDRPLFTTVNGYAYMRGNINFRWSAAPFLIRLYATGVPLLFRIGVAHWRDDALPAYQATVERWRAIDPATASDEQLLRGVRELAWADARYWFAAVLAIGVAKVTDALLNRFLTAALPGHRLTSGTFLRGFPSKTLDAEAELEALAARLRRSDTLRATFEASPVEQVPRALDQTAEGRAFLDALAAYLEQYGHQVYTLDFVVPTQAEDPRAILLSLKALSRGEPRPVEARRDALARERDEAVWRTARSLDPLRRRLFRLLVGWAQRFGPYREQALFYTGLAWPTLRRLALELGARLTAGGALEAPDGIFFLETAEIEAAGAAGAAGVARPDLARQARERRALRQARRRLHPPAAVPPDYRLKLGPVDMSAFETQQRNLGQGAVLRGFAVSPGRVVAAASVVRSPADFEAMQPDSILVCPTTTPAWTPLFAQARGLVTDVGGILAHGSIVAREYGIPAVLGTGDATQRISHGQLIAVDGGAGTVTLSGGAADLALEPDASASDAGPRHGTVWPVGKGARNLVLAGGALAVAAWLVRRSRREG
jgi:pyruvate,water dikinase